MTAWNSKQNAKYVSVKTTMSTTLKIMPVTEKNTTELAYRENLKSAGYNTVNNKRKFN